MRYNERMRVSPGGPATINGIRYQMIWCLLEVATLRFQARPVLTPDKKDVVQTTVILEPSQGGDAHLLRADLQQVVQLKARSGGGTWSLREIVHDVLPDLYRAIDFDREQEFLFVTEGEQGDWGEAKDFFTRLTTLPPPQEGQSALPLLDATRAVRYRGSLQGASGNGFTVPNERDLFNEIVLSLRNAHSHIQAEAPKETERKVWRLLSRLKFRWGETGKQQEVKLLHRLRSLVNNPDDVHNILNILLSKLQERAIRGNETIEADEFFAENGLRGVPLIRRQWSRLVEIGAEQTARDLSVKFKYKPDDDVRPGGDDILALPLVSQWQRGGADCLTLTGESGQGKSWRLYALALALSASDAPVAVVKFDGDAAKAARDAAHHFWSRLCHRTTTLRLDEIGRHLTENGVFTPGATWLYVLVDGVQNPQQAMALYREIGTVEGIRLAFTAPGRVAERMHELPDAPEVADLPITDFTEEETRRYIAGGDAVRWHDIRDEQVRQVIRRPLLAWIYRTLAGESGWDARNEYALYDGYINRHILHNLEDKGLITADETLCCVGLSLWDGEFYPWSLKQMTAFGFTNDLLHSLLEFGFLVRDGQGYYTVWHDRLKEWIVARALATAIDNGDRDPADIGTQCHRLLFTDPWQALPETEQVWRMSFVPMDLVWHLAQRGQARLSTAKALNMFLENLEGEVDSHRWRHYEGLYEHLMPTIGSAIAPALFRRLCESNGEHEDWQKRNSIKRGLATLDAEAVAPEAILLIAHGEVEIRRAASFILANRPVPEALPILWERYLALQVEGAAWDAQWQAARNAPDAHNSLRSADNPAREERNVWSSLKACAPLDPDWVVKAIRALPAPSENDANLMGVSALVCLLEYTNDSGKRWREVKEMLRHWTAVESQDQTGRFEAAFAGVAYAWRDTEEISWLRARVGSDHWQLVGPKCLQALSRIAPDVAVEALPDLSPKHIASTRRWAFRYVFARRPQETRRVLTSMIVTDTKRRWGYAEVFARTPEALMEASLDQLLDDLYEATSQKDADISSLWRALQCIEGVSDLPLLRVLWRRGDEGWDEPLTRLVLKYSGSLGLFYHPMLKTAVKVLAKCNGPGFTKVVNARLQAGERAASLYGTPAAHLRPDAETIRLLAALALTHHPGIVHSKEKFAHPAQEALGRVGAWEPFIRSVVHWGKRSDFEVINARIGLSPLNDDEMAPALTALQADPKHPGAILALGVGQRADWIGHIVAVLNDEDARADNDLTNSCQYALVAMPELPPDAVDAIARRLPYTRGAWLLRPALMKNGSPAALDLLMRYLRTGLYRFRDDLPYGVSDLNDVADVACFLLNQPAVCDEAATLCRERFSMDDKLDYQAQQLVKFIAPFAADYPAARAALDCRPVQDFLNLTAFVHDSTTRHIGEKARLVRGLVAYQPEEAYAAALLSLQDKDAHDQERFPDLLLDINPTRALSDLFALLASPQTGKWMHYHVSRALAVHSETDSDGVGVISMLLQKAHSEEAQERQAACSALAFFPADEVVTETVRTCMDDEDVEVFEAACETWRRVETTRRVGELARAFLTEESPSRRWVLIMTALEVGDLGEAYRPLPAWLQTIYERLAPLEWNYVSEKISKRRVERDRALKK